MHYYNISEGLVTTIAEALPLTSPPRRITDAFLAEHGLARIIENKPDPAPGEFLEPETPVVQADGTVTRDWITRPATQSETDAETRRVRRRRNQRLADCDWIMLPDSTPPGGTTVAEWESYRQALRDMPQAADFDPWAPAWPERPDASTASGGNGDV